MIVGDIREGADCVRKGGNGREHLPRHCPEFADLAVMGLDLARKFPDLAIVRFDGLHQELDPFFYRHSALSGSI